MQSLRKAFVPKKHEMEKTKRMFRSLAYESLFWHHQSSFHRFDMLFTKMLHNNRFGNALVSFFESNLLRVVPDKECSIF